MEQKIQHTTELLCNSCKKRIVNEKGGVIFDCPSCGNMKIVRCFSCRKIAARYKCESCQFSGPN